MQHRSRRQSIVLFTIVIFTSLAMFVFMALSGYDVFTYNFYVPTPAAGMPYPLYPHAQYNVAGNTYFVLDNPSYANGQTVSHFQFGTELNIRKIVNKTRRWDVVLIAPVFCQKVTVDTTCPAPDCKYYPDPVTQPNLWYRNWTQVASVTYPPPSSMVDNFTISRHRIQDSRARNQAFNTPGRFHTDTSSNPQDQTKLYYDFDYGRTGCPGYPTSGTLPPPPPPTDEDDDE